MRDTPDGNSVPFNDPGDALPSSLRGPTPSEIAVEGQKKSILDLLDQTPTLNAPHYTEGGPKPQGKTPDWLRLLGGGTMGSSPQQQPLTRELNMLAPDVASPKLLDRIRNAPGYVGAVKGHDWDQWLLSLPFDPNDQSYNQQLVQERQAAVGRESRRGFDMSGVQVDPTKRVLSDQPAGPAPVSDRDEVRGLVASARERTIVKAYSQLPTVINLFGEQFTDPKEVVRKTKGGLRPPTDPTDPNGSTAELSQLDGTVDNPVQPGPVDAASQGVGPIKSTPMTSKQLARSGKVVWLGQTMKTVQGIKVPQNVYMSVDDAYFLPDSGVAPSEVFPQGAKPWTPQEIAAFQHVVKVPVTGIMDNSTRAKWGQVVQNAAYTTVAGNQADLLSAVPVAAGSGRGGGGGGGRRGGGGGGGGGGRAAVPADQAKALLNVTMQKLAGRQASDGEFNAFLSAIKGAAGSADFDGQQFTEDWVKGRMPQSVGSFQAATDYYQVVQQLIGAA